MSPAHTLKLDKRRGDCTDDDRAPRLGLDERERERETFFTLVREKVVKKYKPAKRREINGLPPLSSVIHIAAVEKLGNNESACYRDRAIWPSVECSRVRFITLLFAINLLPPLPR